MPLIYHGLTGGGIILIIEIAGTRILAPFYGSTIYVWSSLITVTMACLSLGYFVGGRLADKKPELKTLYSIIFLAGLVTVLIPKIDAWILLSSYRLGIIWGSFVATALLFSLPLFLLAMVTPLAVKLKAKALDHLGLTTGNLYAISTVGSLVGALLAGFWLIPSFGISLIFNFIAAVLIAVAFIWLILKKNFSKLFFNLIIVVGLFLIPAYQPVSSNKAKIIYQTPSFYGNIQVVDLNNDTRFLLIDGMSQTGVSKQTDMSELPYVNEIQLARFLTPEINKALVIGLGGGILPQDLEATGIITDIVEIDPKLERIAVNYFDFEPENYNIYFTDGRYFINTTSQNYDLIVIDAFGGDYVPGHLLSLEALGQFKEHLNQSGVLAINIVSFLDSKLSQSLYKTLKQVYPDVLVSARTQDKWTNVLFFAGSNLLDDIGTIVKEKCPTEECIDLYQDILANDLTEIVLDQDIKIITDNHNPSNLWQVKSSQDLRQWALDFFGKDLFTS